MFRKNGVLKNVAKLLQKHLWMSFFSNKLVDEDLRFYWIDTSFITSGVLKFFAKA